MKSLRIVVLSDVTPRLLWRLAERIQNEVSGVTICGVIHDSGSHPQAGRRIGDRVQNVCVSLGYLLLRWIHACPSDPNPSAEFSYRALVEHSRSVGCQVARLDGTDSAAALDLMRTQQADVCLALVSELPARTLLAIPRLGSIVVKAPLLTLRSCDSGNARQNEIKITATHICGADEPTCIRVLSLPIEPYDTPTSIALKANLIGSDLLLECIARIEQEEGVLANQDGCGWMLPSYLSYCERRRVGDLSALWPELDKRPVWKSFFTSLLLLPYVVLRNWYRHWRQRFPVIILAHHLIADTPHPLGMPTEAFFRMVKFLQKHYRIVPLSEAVELLRSGAVGVPTLALSFDDGYEENFLTLRSVTEATGIPVSLFVCTGLLEQQVSLRHDQSRGQHNFKTLNWDQVRYLARNGTEIGSHTRTHFDCGSDVRADLEQEIIGAKSDLQQRLGEEIHFFGFPWGQPQNISAEAMQLAQSTYEHVLSCFGGENFAHVDSSATHLFRKSLQSDLWALELSLQGVLDFRRNLKRSLGWGEEAHGIARVQAAAGLDRNAPFHSGGGMDLEESA